jgi:hypothetical protein
MNIKFNYLYRDNSNYKKYGSVVFTNPNNIDFHLIEEKIQKNLIDGEFFVTEDLGIPSLFFEEHNEDDHGWHEFENLEMTEETGYAGVIEELLSKLIV